MYCPDDLLPPSNVSIPKLLPQESNFRLIQYFYYYFFDDRNVVSPTPLLVFDCFFTRSNGSTMVWWNSHFMIAFLPSQACSGYENLLELPFFLLNS